MSGSGEPKGQPRRNRWHFLGGAALVLIVGVALIAWLWDWNWFRPLVEARLSAALGRPITIDRLEVHPGRVTQVSIYGLKAANPSGFDAANSATLNRLSMTFEAETWLRSRRIVIPLIELDQPHIDYVQADSGKSNWYIAGSSLSSAPPEIGNIRIDAGVAHIHMEKEQADATMSIASQGDSVVVNGKGTYAGQPIVVQALGGALLTRYVMPLHLSD